MHKKHYKHLAVAFNKSTPILTQNLFFFCGFYIEGQNLKIGVQGLH